MAYPQGETSLEMGEDGDYFVRVCDAEQISKIPYRYKFVDTFNDWLKIYDDAKLALEVKAAEIQLFKAGRTLLITKF